MSNTPFRWFKQNHHEGGISGATLAHYPAVIQSRQGTVNHDLGHLIDIMPTVVELTGADYPESIRGHKVKPYEGKSWVDAFHGKSIPAREYLYTQFHTNRALFQGSFKISSFRGNAWELYNIEEDRSELNDLAPENPEILSEMVRSWRAIAKEKDNLPERHFYEAPSEDLQEAWGDRKGQDDLNPRSYQIFYEKLYPKLGFPID